MLEVSEPGHGSSRKDHIMRSLARVLISTSVIALFIVLGATPIHSQDAVEFRLSPRIGYQSGGPLFKTARLADLASGAFVRNVGNPAHLSPSFFVGAGFEVSLPSDWLAIRGAVDRTVGSELRRPETIACEVDCFGGFEGVARWSLSGDLVLHPLPRSAWPVRPFATIGGGVDHYALEKGALENPPVPGALEPDRWSGSAHVGFGADVRTGDYLLRSEVGFYRSQREVTAGWLTTEDGSLLRPLTHSVHQDIVQISVGLVVPLR